MDADDPKEQQGSSDSDSGAGGQESGQPSDSTPNDDVQAPESGSFVKDIPSDTTPDDNIEAPKSQSLTEGFDFDKSEPDDE